MKNDYSIQIRIHAIDAPDTDAAIERAREILVANVPDAHEYALDEIECNDDYDDDHHRAIYRVLIADQFHAHIVISEYEL